MPESEKSPEKLQREIDRLQNQLIDLQVEQIRRKQAEDELWENERRFLRLLDELPLGVFVLDAQGKPYYQNKASRELLGKGLDPETKQRFAELYQIYLVGTGQIYPAERSPLTRALAGERTSVDDMEIRRQDKPVRVEFTASPIFDAQGGVRYAVAAFRDITGRKWIEQEMRLRSEIITQIQEGVMLVRACDGVIVYANPKFEMMFGYGPGELLEKHVAIVNAPTHKTPEETARNITAALKQYGTWTGEIKNRRKDGSDFWCLATISTFQHSEFGEVWLAINQDITARKQAEGELRANIERMRGITEGVIQAMVTMVEKKDPYTAGHQRQVTTLACAMAREIGLSEERIEGLRFAARIHDVGKIQVPAEILTRPGPLSGDEINLIRMHPSHSYDILKAIDFPGPVAEIALQHHERADGSGYPRGLAGDGILLEARILGVADVVASMAFPRPYREGHGIEKALEEISRNRGTRYDAQAVDACLKVCSGKGFDFK